MTLCVFFQKAVDRSARPTSTGHRTHCTQPAGEQDHGARENHYRHVGTFTLLCLSNKHTLRGPFCTITCRVILQPATLVENAGRLLKNHRHPTITVTSLFSSFPPPPLLFLLYGSSVRRRLLSSHGRAPKTSDGDKHSTTADCRAYGCTTRRNRA